MPIHTVHRAQQHMHLTVVFAFGQIGGWFSGYLLLIFPMPFSLYLSTVNLGLHVLCQVFPGTYLLEPVGVIRIDIRGFSKEYVLVVSVGLLHTVKKEVGALGRCSECMKHQRCLSLSLLEMLVKKMTNMLIISVNKPT